MNKVVWEKFATRRGALLKADIYVMLLRKALQKHFGYDTKNFLVCGSGLETQWYLDTQMKRDFGDIILDHFFNSLSRKEDPFQLLKRLKDELMEFTANIKKRKVTSSKEILKTYLEFLEKLGDYQLVIWFPVICEEELFPCAKKRLRKYGCDESDWIILTTPIKPSLLQRENIDLLRTAKNFSPQR